MQHYIITNRKVLTENGKEYINVDGSEEASDTLRFAILDTGKYDFKKVNLKEAITVIPDLKETENLYKLSLKDTKEVTRLNGSERVFADLYQKMSGSDLGDVLLYIHGFNTDLQGAVEDVINIEKKYIKEGSPIKHIVLFTWPARHSLIRYPDDERDAEKSGYALFRGYKMLTDFLISFFAPKEENKKGGSQTESAKPCGKNVHLLAHSMGNQVLQHMVANLLKQQKPTATFFKQIVLAASDVDWSIFEDNQPFNQLTELCERITVYYHKDDAALFISETTKHWENRLGKYGFRNEDKIGAHVYSVDCTIAKGNDGIINHAYFYKEDLVVNDIIKTLNNKNIEDYGDSRKMINAKKFRLAK